MFKCFRNQGKTGFVYYAYALLLVFTMQFSVSALAQQVGGSGNSGTLGSVGATDDICANATDKAACEKLLNADQQNVMQAAPAANPTLQRPVAKVKASGLPPTNEFQDFIAMSVGKKLSLYAHNLFENARHPRTHS